MGPIWREDLLPNESGGKEVFHCLLSHSNLGEGVK